MKAKNIFLNIVIVFATGLLIYGMWEATKIFFDGTPMLVNVFDRSLHDRYVQYPDEMKSANTKMYIAVPLSFVLFLVVAYLRPRTATTEPEPVQEVKPVSKKKRIKVPITQSRLDNWIEAYPIIDSMKKQNKTLSQIRSFIYDNYHHLPCDEEIIQAIWDEGQAGNIPGL